MEMIPSPRLGFLRGVFLASHLASTDNLMNSRHLVRSWFWIQDGESSKVWMPEIDQTVSMVYLDLFTTYYRLLTCLYRNLHDRRKRFSADRRGGPTSTRRTSTLLPPFSRKFIASLPKVRKHREKSYCSV